jgi:hypothetical protein
MRILRLLAYPFGKPTVPLEDRQDNHGVFLHGVHDAVRLLEDLATRRAFYLGY